MNNKWLPLIIVCSILMLFMIFILFLVTKGVNSETIVTECNSSFINETNGLLTNFNELSTKFNDLSDQNTNCIAEKNTINQKYLDQLNKNNKLQQNITNTKPTTCNTCVRQVKDLDARLKECYINQTNSTIIAQNQTLLSMYTNKTEELKNCTDKLEVITQWLNKTI